jgi:type IV pilus assembly protein PilM
MPILQVLQFIPEFKSHTTVAVIDMGAEATHVLIIKEGLPRLSRTIPIGGNDFTENVASSFSIPFDEAEKVKLEYGTLEIKEMDWSQVDLMTNPYMGVSEVLHAIAQDVFGEIKRSFVHFQLHNRGQLIEKVYLTGGSSRLIGIAEGLENFLNVPVDPLNVSPYFAFEPDLRERVEVEGPIMMEALGLALSGV